MMSLSVMRVRLVPAAISESPLAKLIEQASAMALGISVGYAAWGRSNSTSQLLWLLLLPIAWGVVRSRLTAAVMMLGYFASATSALPGGATVFFGDLAPLWFGWALWGAAAVVLAAPFVAIRPESRFHKLSFAITSCVLIPPPVGLVGWVNPICVSGALFPGFGWAGVVLTLIVFEALAVRRWAVIGGCIVVALLSNGAFAPPSDVAAGWYGANTSFAKLSGDGYDDAQQLLASMQRVRWLSNFAETVPAGSVTVLPETVIGSYNGLAQYNLFDVESTLHAKGARILVGAEVEMPGGKYENTLVVLGRQQNESLFAVQRIPVPISMWKPLSSTGAVASVFAPRNTLAVGGRHVGIAICYEQLLPYSLLATLSGDTDLLVAASNVWWARNTSIPNIQKQTTGAFARLFAVPVISAFNI